MATNIGPLDSFVFPGVYTKTLLAPPSATAAGAVRFPAIIGTGIEEERVEAFEIVRGSSATADNIIVGEDPTNNGKTPGIGYSWNTVDGINAEFHVKWAPIVDGSGTGNFATKAEQVIVTVDGENVPVFSVDGANGIVKTVDAPASGSTVSINYYYKRRDTFVENEDVSVQVPATSGTVSTFKVKSARIVKGDNGGYAATASSIGASVTTVINGQLVAVPVIKVLVNGVEAPVGDINGNEGTFTMATPVAHDSAVLVSYFSNDFANTYDILPAASATAIQRVGYDPNRADFAGNKDYVLANGNEIHWGNSSSVSSGINTAGKPVFGVNQVSALQIDNRYYKVPVASSVDGSTKTFTLPYQPVRGDGTGKFLYDPADGTPASYDDLKIWVGTTLAAATLATVASITADTVTLTVAPALGASIWADLYVNRLVDDTWTLTKVSAAGATGTYTIVGTTYGSARQVTADLAASTSTATYLDQAESTYDGVAGGCNAYIKPSRSQGNEIITAFIPGVTGYAGYTGAFSITSNVASGTRGTGVVGQTYIDPVTGFTLSLATASATGATGALIYNVTNTVTAVTGGSDIERGIPGIKLTVTDQANTGISSVVAGDTATVSTFNLNDETEPNVGDLYYVTFDKAKADYSVKYLTSFPDVLRSFGPLSQNNPVVIAANLAFLNGATSVAIKQIQKVPGASDAAVSDYISAISIFDEPLTNGARPALLQPLSTDSQVIAALKASNAQQSSIRFKNERTSYFGFRTGTNPDTVINRVRALNTEVLTAVYPDGGVVTLKDSFGADQDIVIGGEYVAVAMAGADVAPVRDIATPLTNVNLVGFKRLYRNLTTVVASQVANAGCTVLESRFGVTRVIMALTTDLTSVLTRDPRIVEVKNFVQQGVRSNLNGYIGQKNLPGMTGKIQATLDSYFFSLQQAEIISAYKPSKATVNAADPSTVDVTTYYSPVFPLNWIVATLNLNSTLS